MNPEETKAQEPTAETQGPDRLSLDHQEGYEGDAAEATPTDTVAPIQPEDGANEAQGVQQPGLSREAGAGTRVNENPRYSEDAHHFRNAYLALLQGLIIAGKSAVDAGVHALAVRGAEMAIAAFDAKYPKELPAVEGVAG